MGLVQYGLAERGRGDRDARPLQEQGQLGADAKARQFFAGDDDRLLRRRDQLGRLGQRFLQCSHVARNGLLLARLDLDASAHEVSRQLQVHRAAVPQASGQGAVDLTLGGVGIGDDRRRAGDLAEDVELALEAADLVVEEGFAAPLAHPRPAADDDHGRSLGERLCRRVHDLEAADAIGHAQGTDAVDAGIGVGGVSSPLLVRAVDDRELGSLQLVIEPQHVVAGDAEDVPHAQLGQPADEVRPDRGAAHVASSR